MLNLHDVKRWLVKRNRHINASSNRSQQTVKENSCLTRCANRELRSGSSRDHMLHAHSHCPTAEEQAITTHTGPCR